MNPVSDIDESKYVAKAFFTYDLHITSSLANAASTTVSLNVAADSDFYWSKTAIYAQSASDGTTQANQLVPGVTLLITNTITGRQYMNEATPAANIAGTAQLPFILPMRTLWESMTTITVQIANVTDNTTYSELYLSFIGIKAFLKPQGNR